MLISARIAGAVAKITNSFRKLCQDLIANFTNRWSWLSGVGDDLAKLSAVR